MRMSSGFLSIASLFLFACGSSDSPLAPGASPGPESFSPPPPAFGYTRIVAPVVADISPGADMMFCQYIQAPLDHDIDILDVKGFQSAFGHHAVAYASTATTPVGSSGPCTDGEAVLQGTFLGGTGGEGGSGVNLPEGVAFRLPKGNSILLNAHFLNTSTKSIEGRSVLDFKIRGRQSRAKSRVDIRERQLAVQHCGELDRPRHRRLHPAAGY